MNELLDINILQERAETFLVPSVVTLRYSTAGILATTLFDSLIGTPILDIISKYSEATSLSKSTKSSPVIS